MRFRNRGSSSRDRRIGLVWVVLVGAAWLWAGLSAAQDGAPPYSDPLAIHNAVGLTPEEADLVLTWQERARDGSGRMIQGARFDLGPDLAPLDVYFAPNGALLDESQAEALGIRQKPATPGASVQGYPAPARDKARSLQRPPPVVVKPTGAVALPALDRKSIAEEDAASAGKPEARYRTGVRQPFADDVRVAQGSASHGRWTGGANGARVWAITISAPGAMGQRVHFTDLDLPEGARLAVYGQDNPDAAFSHDAFAPDGDGGFWSPTCFDETVVVQCVAPSGVNPQAVSFGIDEILHTYRGGGKGDSAKAAGACNLDSTCYPEWADAAAGVARIGIIGESGFACSGVLLANPNPNSDDAYFLTANHCVDTNSRALTLEFFWLYQTDTCNGTPPSLASVPRTLSAKLVATSTLFSGTDFTLLRLIEEPPAEAFFVGWSSEAQPIGTDTTCIHHPQAEYKRITFGDVTLDEDDCSAGSGTAASNPDRYYQSTWTDGTTEGGSSGSPLLNDNQQVIGQLWGGSASCFQPTCPDYYGRFDKTFQVVEAFLDPDSDGDGLTDAEEENGAFGFTSDPALVDTDGDTISDFDEVMATNGFQTNPNLEDTDGDGISDPLELLHGFDPTSATSVPDLGAFSVPFFTGAR